MPVPWQAGSSFCASSASCIAHVTVQHEVMLQSPLPVVQHEVALPRGQSLFHHHFAVVE